MKLQEAIDHLSESLNDPNREWCEECRQEHEQLHKFLVELKWRRKIESHDKKGNIRAKAWIWQAKYNDLLLSQMKDKGETENRINGLEKRLESAEQRAEFMRGIITAYEKILFRLPWLIADEESGDE